MIMPRKKTSIKRIAGVIAISVPMLMFGGSLFNPNAADEEVEVKVGDQIVRNAQFRIMLANRIEQASETAGFDVAANETALALLADELRNQLASRLLFFGMLEELGITPTDQEIYRQIGTLEEFQDDGKFSSTRFKALVSDEREFVERMREQLKSSRILWLTSVSAVVDKGLINEIARYYSSVRKVSKYKIDPQDFRKADSLAEADLLLYYQANQRRYLEPEQAEFEYVELSRADLAQDLEVGEDELQEAYERRQLAASRRDERQLQLIVLDDQEAAAEALVRARAAPNSFAELAKELSVDSGSRELGGDVGFLAREDLDPDMAEDIFAAEIGAVLGPYQNDGKWQLFRVAGMIGRNEGTVAELRDTLLREVRQDKAALLLEELGRQLEDATFDAEGGLETAASSLGLAMSLSGNVRRHPSDPEDNPPEFRDTQLLGELFRDDFVASGGVSGLLADGDGGRYMVARVIAHSPARILTFDEAEERVREDAEQAYALDKALEYANELVGKLAEGNDVLPGGFALSAQVALEEDLEILPEGFNINDIGAAFGGNFAGTSLPVYAVAVSPAQDSISLLRIDGITWGTGNETVRGNAAKALKAAMSQPTEISLLEDLALRYDIYLKPPDA